MTNTAIALDFDPRTVAIQPQDILYYGAQIYGDTVTPSATLKTNQAGLFEMASRWNLLSQVPAIRPSRISEDAWLRYRGYISASTDARPAQGTLLMTQNPASSEEVSLNDGTGARAYSFAADGNVVVPIGSDVAQSARNLVIAIREDVEAGNAALDAVHLGADLFGTTGELVVFWPTTPSEWGDNDTITTDITNAVATGFTLGVAGT